MPYCGFGAILRADEPEVLRLPIVFWDWVDRFFETVAPRAPFFTLVDDFFDRTEFGTASPWIVFHFFL